MVRNCSRQSRKGSMMSKCLLIALLMTASLFETSFAVRCYKCSYPTDKSCLNPSSSTATKQCDSGFCKTQKAEMQGQGSVDRDCQPYQSGLTNRCDGGGAFCYCNTDLCNNVPISGANGNSIERSLSIAAALLVVVFLF